MTDQTIVLITGVGRGIGRAIVEQYLLRPNHTVIGTVRDATSPQYDTLKTSPVHSTSTLHLFSIESTSLTDQSAAIDAITAAGISHLDIVIANAGIASYPVAPDSARVKDVLDCFQVNAVSPFLLYQAVKPLLDKSKRPVWMAVSSAAGSIASVETLGTSIITPYGMSKSALNWLTKSIHAAETGWIAFCIHPGVAQSDMGARAAAYLGLEKAPVTLEDCSNKTIAQIDTATRETTSGKFIDVIQGVELPW